MFKKSIAIIDDDPDLLNIFSEALQMSGYHDVSSFTDPLLAYEHIQENPNKYSLLIIDDKMPNISGLFMGTKLLEINPKLNVIILSDYFAKIWNIITSLIFLKNVYQYLNLEPTPPKLISCKQ